MALHSVPLLGPAGPSLQSTSPDFYVAECHHVQSAASGSESEHFRGMAVLVNLSDDSADRMALWPLRDALAFARCTVVGGAEWPDWLAKRVAALQPAFATATVFVDCSGGVVAETVQAAIDTLRRLLGTALALVVVVSSAADSLVSLDGVSGFVHGVRSTNGDSARQVFLALSVFLAPETLNGIDILDLLPVLGPASAPTVLVEALWFREDDGRLLYPSNADKHAVANAARVVAIPFIRDSGWSDARRFCDVVRQDAAACRSLIVFATNNALTPSFFPGNVSWVPVFCNALPDAKASEEYQSDAERRFVSY